MTKHSTREELLAEFGADKRTTMSVGEAAVLLGVGRNLAYRAAHSGQLPVVMMGKRMLIPVAPLLRMLDGTN